MSCYHHLTISERERLFKFRVMGYSIRDIARQLGRSPSTVSRELARNAPEYLPSQAQEAYHTRRKKCVRTARLADMSLNVQVRFFLTKLIWSPEQISERLRLETGMCVISTSTIYRGLENGLLRDTVRYYLRHKYKTLGKAKKPARKCFMRSIALRPPEAKERSEIGHWEGDTVMGHNERARLVTLVDRKTRYTLIAKVPCAEAEIVESAIVEQLRGHEVRSVTFDQGIEFSASAQLEKEIHAPVYFAHPHSPWERPTNENTNGLIRQFVPKRRSLKDYTDDDIQRFAAWLNLRPRKCLGWRTPDELLHNRLLHFT